MLCGAIAFSLQDPLMICKMCILAIRPTKELSVSTHDKKYCIIKCLLSIVYTNVSCSVQNVVNKLSLTVLSLSNSFWAFHMQCLRISWYIKLWHPTIVPLFIGGQAGNIRARFEKMATEGAEVGAVLDRICCLFYTGSRGMRYRYL